ncbi:uncharacterized protein C6orf47 homolog [Gastrophryne carolinensis]
MFLPRSMHWPSTPAFFSKFLRSSKSTPSQKDDSPLKPRRWTLPVIPLPSLQTVRSYLPSLKSYDKPRPVIHTNIDSEHFQICINLVHHIIDVCASGCLWLFSPVFRITLDVLGLQGALKLWIHGLAIFLTTVYGMYLLFWLAQEYVFQLTSLYGILQTLVLIVSLRAEREVDDVFEEPKCEPKYETKKEEAENDEEEEIQFGEDRWAGGSEDEGDSQDEWESEGEEIIGNA